MNNKLIATLLLVSLSLNTHGVFAGESFLQRMDSITSMSGDFHQIMVDADGEEIGDPLDGKFCLQRPGQFYWETFPPYPQKVIRNGQGLLVYDPDLEQLTIYSEAEFANTPGAILSGGTENIRDAYAIESREEKQRVSYILREKNKSDKSFESLSFTFEKSTLVSIELVDQLEQRTHIDFKNMESGKALDAEIFAFTPPQGVEIIRKQ